MAAYLSKIRKQIATKIFSYLMRHSSYLVEKALKKLGLNVVEESFAEY
jgi:hypothetical protein